MKKPEQVEKEYNFTYSQLHLLLRLFGTSVGVAIQKMEKRSEDGNRPLTYHTDIVTEPLVSQYMQEVDKGFYQMLVNRKI